MNRALERLAVSQRKDWTEYERKTLLERQDHHCPCCGDKLVKYEIDHKTPLCRGGTNELDNLQALCPLCHAGKTQDEEQETGRMHTVESQLSPLLWKELHKCPKPAEVSWGKLPKVDLA
jgi:5-methylcytosine-specific restriction endonuclease McrA